VYVSVSLQVDPLTIRTINYDVILDTAMRGVRRAAVFMGLGLNAARDPDFKRYELTDIAAIQLVPPDADAKTLAHYKENFALWITANGLRELIESFSIFLDQVYDSSQVIAANKGNRAPSEAVKKYKQFSGKGVKEKLAILETEFSILTPHADHISSIYLARNCLTHRLGRVEGRDCNEGTELVVKWFGLDIIAATANGDSAILDLPLQQPVEFQAETTMSVRIAEHTQRYGQGTVVRIPPKDLAEICMFMAEEAKRILRSAVDYARNMGIVVQEKSISSEPKPAVDTAAPTAEYFADVI
jgi:hypothetical protein